MLFCNECGYIFHENDLREEPTGVYHAGVDQMDKVCPGCGGDDYQEAILCNYCHEWEPESSFMGTGIEYMCESCYLRAIKGIKNMLEAKGTLAEVEVFAYLREIS